ncbi:hypothetical protein Naga_100369g1 [Nannochloropsis gaditana]|uniref:Uncharacterized protein n=1 Tax=Nannochloropsis gaditana TaxID=72520 RepID=W7TXY1_9STRA|nr:hypothetical protein Naga_100369g1 [Nannochloropsis gaditana]
MTPRTRFEPILSPYFSSSPPLIWKARSFAPSPGQGARAIEGRSRPRVRKKGNDEFTRRFMRATRNLSRRERG